VDSVINALDLNMLSRSVLAEQGPDPHDGVFHLVRMLQRVDCEQERQILGIVVVVVLRSIARTRNAKTNEVPAVSKPWVIRMF
jgi:hypothetical protein